MITDGWEKDGDFNTTFSRTVLPLPTHRSARYDQSPGRLEDDPVYKQHPKDFAEYHTRYVTPDAGAPRADTPERSRTMTRYARPVLALVFIALLATPYLMRRYGPRAAVAAGTVSDPRSQYGFRLKESAKAAGIDFLHEAPTLDAKLAHIMPQVASMGAAVSVVDVDADGLPDLHVTNSREGSHNRLYRNRGDGTFEDIAGRVGLADVNRRENGVSMGAVWGDYDNDGYDDVLLHRWGRTELLRNEGGRAFAPVTTAGLPEWANINSAVWFDFDRDGRLDLFLGGVLSGNRQPLEACRYEDDAGELRVRRERRAEVSVSQSRRRPVRGGQRARGSVVSPLGAGGGRRRPAGHRVSRSLHRQRLRRLRAVPQRGRPVPRGRAAKRAWGMRRRAA